MRAPARARRSNTGSRYGSARASTASPPRRSGRPRRRSVSRRRFRGRPRNVFCLGRNYMEHAAKRGAEAPAHPVYFRKAPECVLAPGGKIVHHPVTQELDYEVELAVVIGAAGRDNPRAGAPGPLFFFTSVQHTTATATP